MQPVTMTGHVWTSWSLDPAVIGGVLLAGWAYSIGLRAITGRRRPRIRWRASAFFGGLAAVVVALISPVDSLAGRLLSAHMVQHLLLILVAAPLLVLGRPTVPVWLALPRGGRVAVRRATRIPALAACGRLLRNPVVAWLLHVSVLWAWHAPGPYQAALSSPWTHALEHATFLGTAVLFWWVALRGGPRRVLAPGADVLYVLAAWLQSAALGALFTFATSPLYPLYARVPGSPLHDQQVAGLVMWIPAGMVYLGAATALAIRWLRGLKLAAARIDPGPIPGPQDAVAPMPAPVRTGGRT